MNKLINKMAAFMCIAGIISWSMAANATYGTGVSTRQTSAEDGMPLGMTCPYCSDDFTLPDGWWSENWSLPAFTSIGIADRNGESVGSAIINIGRKTSGNKVPVNVYALWFLDQGGCIIIDGLYPINQDGDIEILRSRKGIGKIDLTITANGKVSGMIGQYIVGESNGLEVFENGEHLFKMEIGEYSLNAAYALIDAALKAETSIIIQEKKWDCGKSESIRYKKNRDTGEYELFGLGNPARPNTMNLKLKFDARQNSFKGSFVAYATNAEGIAPGKKPKLKKYTFSVSGKIQGSSGSGLATCKKLKATWPVTIE